MAPRVGPRWTRRRGSGASRRTHGGRSGASRPAVRCDGSRVPVGVPPTGAPTRGPRERLLRSHWPTLSAVSKALTSAANPLRSSRARARSRTSIAPGGQGNPTGRSGLRPLAGDAPLASLSIHLAPKRPAGFSRPYRCQDQEPEAETGRNARLRPVHGFKRRRYFRVRQRPEVRLDGQHGRQRALDSFPGHVLLDVAMRPTPPQQRADPLLEEVSSHTIRDCERVRHSRRQSAASSALVSRSRAMPTGGRRSKPSPRFFALGTTRFSPPARHLPS